MSSGCLQGPPGGGDCVGDDDCTPGEQCVQGTCRSQCENDAACEDAESCVDGTCQPGAGECETAADCTLSGARCDASINAFCQGGLCTCDECETNSECDDSNACSVDACVRGLCTHDGAPLVGDPCPVNTPNDGVCAVVGEVGVCGLPDGTTCQAHADCAAGCECANNTCGARVCAPEACVCKYGALGACTTDLPDGTHDIGDCEDESACFGGECLLVEGEPCTADAECGDGNCECADEVCLTKACSLYDCPCQYLVTGVCGAEILDGEQGAEDCAGEFACFGGECLLDLGEACDNDFLCGSGHCECTNLTCSTRVCSANDCDCGYGLDGACTNDVQNGPNDPLDCPTDCQGGVCAVPLGGACSADNQCLEGQCECTNDTCTTGACNLTPCLCHYGFGGSCSVVALNNGSTDIGDCAGEFACYGGQCMLADGASCNFDADCGPGFCECTDPTCSNRACTDADCECGFGIDGACSGNLFDGEDDPGDCEGPTQSCWAGACGLDDGAPCVLDNECRSGACQLGFCEQLRCTPSAISAVPYSGSGSAGDPYVICTVTQLNQIRNRSQDWSSVFYLGANLDFLGTPTQQIVPYGNSFNGTFDGRGYELRNMNQDTQSYYGGLFYQLNGSAVVRNLALEDVDLRFSGSNAGIITINAYAGTLVEGITVNGVVESYSDFGLVSGNQGTLRDIDIALNWTPYNSVSINNMGFAASANNGTLERVHASGTMFTSWNMDGVGGLVGVNQGVIQDSSADVDIDTSSNGNDIGGLVGRSYRPSQILRSWATGNVDLGSGSRGGGLVGAMYYQCCSGAENTIQDSYATGMVAGEIVGGLVGDATDGLISRSYASGAVSIPNGGCCNVYAGGLLGTADNNLLVSNSVAVGVVTALAGGEVGGLIGDNNSATVQNCYWYNAAGDQADVCSPTQMPPLGECTEEATLTNFYDSSYIGYSTWDFTGVWQENVGAMPTLRP